jgi:hypothetical protein
MKIYERRWQSKAGEEYTQYNAAFDDTDTLKITGFDLSATAEEIWGDDEVEYFYEIPKHKLYLLTIGLIVIYPLNTKCWLSFVLPNPLLVYALKDCFENERKKSRALERIKALNTKEISMW